jgi:hypothetical protein
MSNPTDAITRFRKSMIIDYDAWKEGTPYDIPALADVTPEERDRLTDEICERSSLDWRDVEALRALATPKAIKRVGVAAEKQTDGGGIEAFMPTKSKSMAGPKKSKAASSTSSRTPCR